MNGTLSTSEESQLLQTIEMFEVITESQPSDCQSLEILKEAYLKLTREEDVIRTSRRIAEAYVMLGQFSSAILEYESILQHRPDDTDVLEALAQIESKAGSLDSAGAAMQGLEVQSRAGLVAGLEAEGSVRGRGQVAEVDDGRRMMQKVFVDSRLISSGDFEHCWVTPDYGAPNGVVEPFIQRLAERGVFPMDRSLALLCEKTRLGFLGLERYDIDYDLTRSFPAEVCRRWCVLPFDRMSKAILIGTANPYNRQAAKELEAVTNGRLILYLAAPPDLVKGLKRAFH